jgi:hypothetical protein
VPEIARQSGHEKHHLEAESIISSRLGFLPLKAADADEMQRVLNDQALYEYTGGKPPSVAQLRARYEDLRRR